MEQQLNDLMNEACRANVVLHQDLADGLRMLACPLPHGAIVGLGRERDSAHRIDLDRLLRERSRELPLLGVWLPVQLRDGGVYLVRRVAPGADALPVGDAGAATARQLLR